MLNQIDSFYQGSITLRIYWLKIVYYFQRVRKQRNKMAFSAFPLLILILVFPSDLVTIETGEDSLSLRTSTNTTEERAGSNIVIMKNYYNSCFTRCIKYNRKYRICILLFQIHWKDVQCLRSISAMEFIQQMSKNLKNSSRYHYSTLLNVCSSN